MDKRRAIRFGLAGLAGLAAGLGLAGVGLAGLGLAGLSAAPAFAQNPDMQWGTGSFNDPQNKGRYTVMLDYSVPETDNVQMRGRCSAGSSHDWALVTLGYDTGRRRDGDKVIVKFFADGQEIYQKPGRVSAAAQEEGLSGVRFTPGFEDYFWQVLSRGGDLSYRIGRGDMATMNLDGADLKIAEFTGACKAIYAASNPGSGQDGQDGQGGQNVARGKRRMGVPSDEDNEENNPGPAAASCERFGEIKSVNSNIPVTIRFNNRTQGYRAVLWLNYEGRPVQYFGLNPGQSQEQQTFVGHPWMLTDGPGNCKEVYVPREGDRRYNITFE